MDCVNQHEHSLLSADLGIYCQGLSLVHVVPLKKSVRYIDVIKQSNVRPMWSSLSFPYNALPMNFLFVKLSHHLLGLASSSS